MIKPDVKGATETIVKALTKDGYEPIGDPDDNIRKGEVDLMMHKEGEMPIVIRIMDILTLLVGVSEEDEKEKV